jgi:VCBS repeat-containing protein
VRATIFCAETEMTRMLRSRGAGVHLLTLFLLLTIALSWSGSSAAYAQSADGTPVIPVESPTESPVPSETEAPTSEPTATSEATAEPSATTEAPADFSAAELPDVSFSSATYTGAAGSTIVVTLNISMDEASEGTVAITAPEGTQFVSGSGSATAGVCTVEGVVPVPGGELTGSFNSPGPAMCTFTMSLQLNYPGNGAGTSVAMIARIRTYAPSPLRYTAETQIFVTLPSVNTLSIVADNANPLPGDVVQITVSHPDDSGLTGAQGELEGSVPAGTTLAAGTGLISCSTGCATLLVSESPTLVSGTYSILPGTAPTISLDYTVTVDPGTAPGTILTFNGDGTLVDGTPTGPDTVSITVAAAPVVATGTSITVPFEGSGNGAVSASGGFGAITFAIDTSPTKGTATVNPDGSFEYVAASGQTGTDQFTILASDSSLPAQTAVATVDVTIGDPDALVAQSLTLNIESGGTITGELVDQVSGGIPPYTFVLATGPALGTVTIEPDGTFTYQAHSGASGTDSFTYTVTDSTSGVVEATATTTGTVTIIIAAPLTPVPSPTPSPTTEPGEPTPIATEQTGTVEPGDPEITQTPVDPRVSETPDSGNGTDPVTHLPSTGAGGSQQSMPVVALLVAGVMMLAAAVIAGRRRANG